MNFLQRMLDNLATSPQLASVVEIHSAEERTFTGTELLSMMACVRGFLAARSLRPGDRVALLAGNSAKWVAADLAVVAHGCITVPLYERQDRKELAVMLRDSDPVLLIAATADLAREIGETWPHADRIVTYEQVFAHAPLEGPPHAIADADPVAIIYTSGTSGEPKGVILSRRNIDFMIPRTIERLQQVVGSQAEPDRVFHYLPMCFAAARMMMWTQLSRPNPIMLSSDLNNLVAEMATAQPHYFLNVPALLERVRAGVTAKLAERGGVAWALFDRAWEAHGRIKTGKGTFFDRLALALAQSIVLGKVRAGIGPRLRFLISGSAPLAEDTQEWFGMLGIPVYQAYGLTETTGIVSLDEPARVVPGRVGVALDGIETKIGDEGELLIRGPNVFEGYWNKPEATADVMRDGWFHTGDQVDIDRGNIRIIGRIKNLIVPESGHNVAPEPLEERFKEYCPEASQCVVVGHGRPHLAIIVTGAVAEERIKTALDRINGEVPHYRKIRRFVNTKDEFTVENGLLTANQKLRRRVIEEHFRPQIDAIYQ